MSALRPVSELTKLQILYLPILFRIRLLCKNAEQVTLSDLGGVKIGCLLGELFYSSAIDPWHKFVII